MRICLICVELFSWGKFGGFGRATRTIGRELVKRGVEVFAVVPRRAGQRPIENLDGMTVLSFPSGRPWKSKALFVRCNADIYHSCEPSLGTYLAQRAMPLKKHIVTLRDTREFADWRMEFALPSVNKRQVIANYIYEDNPLVSSAVRRSDSVYSAAKLIISKAQRKYHLDASPKFLPTPVTVCHEPKKARIPTVCYMGRWDRRKRPELFMELASAFPEVHFIAAGASRDKKWDNYLREKYGGIANLQMPGFVDQFQSSLHSKILEESWVMVNSAIREGLPNAFLEAAAHGCAILSAVNPDEFASRFGVHVVDDRFIDGLKQLLKNNEWFERGERGRKHVMQHFALDHAIDCHLECYEQLLRDS